MRLIITCAVLASSLLLTTIGELAGTADPAISGQAACASLLVNGNFEAGASGWEQFSAGGQALISDFKPRSGTWGAYLGGMSDTDDRLSQTALLPATATTISLRFWWAIATEEPATGSYDTLTVSLRHRTARSWPTW